MKQVKENKKILMVVDEPEMQIFLSKLLETGSFDPIIAENGIEGLQKAREENPALIILDVMVSGQESARMYRKVKHDNKLRKIPVILLSAISRDTFFHYEHLENGQSGHGVPKPEGFLEKPPEAAEVLNLIKDILSKESQTK